MLRSQLQCCSSIVRYNFWTCAKIWRLASIVCHEQIQTSKHKSPVRVRVLIKAQQSWRNDPLLAIVHHPSHSLSLSLSLSLSVSSVHWFSMRLHPVRRHGVYSCPVVVRWFFFSSWNSSYFLRRKCTILVRLTAPVQWSNYEGARGGLAPLKDRMAPSKRLVWEGTRGPLKAPPPEIASQIQYVIATSQCHSKHRWWSPATWLISHAQFFVRRNQRCRLIPIVAVYTCVFSLIQIAQHLNITYSFAGYYKLRYRNTIESWLMEKLVPKVM